MKVICNQSNVCKESCGAKFPHIDYLSCEPCPKNPAAKCEPIESEVEK
jgi:hypothetical protein